MAILARGQLLTCIFTSALAAQEPPSVAGSEWAVRAIDTLPATDDYTFGFRAIRFQNGRRLTVVLNELEILGELPRPGRPPVLVLGGQECGACDAETRVYLVPVAADFVDPRPRSFAFPGTAQPGGEPEGAIHYRGRLFLGQCTGPSPEAVWLQSERDSTGQWHDSAFQVRALSDSLSGSFLQPGPTAAAITERVQLGKCQEVPGRQQYVY